MAHPVRLNEKKTSANLQIGDRTLSLHKGDLMALAVDAVVCPINPELNFNVGLPKIISQAAGRAIRQERPLAPEPYGKVVVMPGGKLKAKYIFFTVLYGERGLDKMRLSISQAVDRTIRYAEFLRLKSIAFPVLGNPAVMPPYDIVAHEMLENALKYFQRRNTKIKAILFSAFNTPAFEALRNEARQRAD